MLASTAMKPLSSHTATPKRRPGRPPVYVFTKPDAELSENERRLKGAVLKRRIRQNRSYHRKKRLRQLQTHELPAAPSSSFRVPPPPPLLSSPPPRMHHNPNNNIFMQNAPPSTPPPPFPIPSLSHALPSLVGPPHPPQHSQSPTPHSQPQPLSVQQQHEPVVLSNNPLHHSLPMASPSQVFRAPVGALTPLQPPTNSRPALSYFSLSPNVPDCTSLTQSTPIVPPRAEALTPTTSSLPNFQNRLPDPLSPTPFQQQPQTQQQPTLTHSPKEHRGNISKLTHSQNGIQGDEDQIVQFLDVSGDRSLSTSTTLARHVPARPNVEQDLSNRLATLPSSVVNGLNYLMLFPESFSVESANAVAATSFAAATPPAKLNTFTTEFISPLVDAGVVKRLSSGRYSLNGLSRSLIKQPYGNDMTNAARRFVQHFTMQLKVYDTHSLSKDGRGRLQAMKMYDAERSNMHATLQLCKRAGGARLALNFLTHSATVMRYSVPPMERVTIFTNALNDVEGLSNDMDDEQSDVRKMDAEARVTLALGEAYLDMLSFVEAGKHLSKAVGMMATGPAQRSPLCITTSVLALLLLAELRISDGQFTEGSKLLGQALISLRDADLQKSTFAVCSLLSMGSVYNCMDDRVRAMQTVQTALDVLKELGFERLPIYADGLRALGMIHLSSGDSKEAQRIFFSALNIVEGWTTPADWSTAPFQHCGHLDVFLIEAIARTYLAQGREGEAKKLYAHAQQQRRDRHLSAGLDDFANPSHTADGGGSASQGQNGRRLFTRHLY